MGMDRSEQVGLGVAAAAHVLLFGALSFNLFSNDSHRFDNPPMAVEIVAETAEQSVAPVVSAEEPAPRLGESEAPDPPPAPEPEPEPEPRPAPPPPRPKVEPRPAPRPVATPTPPRERTPPRREPERDQRSARSQPDVQDPRRRPDRERPADTRREPQRQPARPRPTANPAPSGDLDGIAASVARNTRGRTPNPPAERSGSEIRRSIQVSINAAVRAPWNACRVTGVDVNQLTTTVVFRLTPTGALDRIVSVNTTGVTDSNRPQLQRFEECARRAIQLAAPFDLPRENYEYWQTYTLDFEKR